MTKARTPISACVIAMNEEDNIQQCLASLTFCDEIILVDSHSTDRTREIAESMGARVFERDWPGFGEQKEFAVEQAEHEWVLCMDADEWLSEELQREIQRLAQSGLESRDGFSMPRLSNYFGTWVRRGGWYPDRQLRLYKKSKGRWSGNPPHEKVTLQGSVTALSAPIHHRPYRSLQDHLTKIDGYTTTMAREMFRKGKRASVFDLIFRPALRFFRFYVLKLGFVHGWVGLYLSYLDAHYVRLKYAKLLGLQRGLPLEDGD